MSYKEKPQIKLYKYENSAFVLQAIIDDYAECSFEDNRFEAGQFSISINYNIPNALKFERGLWIQFGNNQYKFGEILNITDSIGADGKESQIRIITGYDARYIFKRRIIKNLNNNDTWSMTAKGEICMRNLIQDQCGSGAETKRQLPITNIIPDSANAIGAEYSVSEAYSNLYEVLTTIATQSEIGWRLRFSGSALTLEFYEGVDRHLTVRFDTDYESLSNGEFTDSAESYANTVYVGGKGTGSERDIFEGEELVEGQTPSGLDRFEAWDNQSEMTTEDEYEAEALSMLSQYGQTLEVSGNGLAKCPYEYEKEYNVGDIITIAFSGKSAVVQILSVTEHWTWGNYNLEFSFGKPINNLGKQLQLMLKQIQKASSKTTATESVKWYTIPTATSMPASDVTFDTIGFSGDVGSGATFTLYLDDEKTGSKNYNLYIRNLSGTGKLTLTTGKTGATNAVLEVGNYVGRIYVDENGNVKIESLTATSTIASGNNQPATSGGVADAIKGNTIYNPCYNNVDSLFDIDTVGAGHRTYASVSVGGGTSGSCPSDFGVVYTITSNGTAWKFQIAKETYSDTTYTRQNINNGGWSAWQKVFTNGNFTMMSPWNNVHRFTMTKDKFYLLFTGSPNFPNSDGGMNMYLVMAPHPSIAELTGYVEEIKVIQTSTTVSINGDDIVISSPNYSVAVLMPITN